MKVIESLIIIALGLALSSQAIGQDSWANTKSTGHGELHVYIQNEYPFAFEEAGELVGVEVDILKAFAAWCKVRHDVEVNLVFHQEDEFFKITDAVRNANNTIGAASITVLDERKSILDFTAPYMRNKSVLVSPLAFETLKSYADFGRVFSGATGLCIPETTHCRELKEIKGFHYPKMVIKSVWTTNDALEEMKRNPKTYTMVDLLTFWNWVNNGEQGLKVHRVATVDREEFAFAVSKGSDWTDMMNQFFTNGIGFTGSAEYKSILEKYLAEGVIEDVAK